MRQDGWGTRFCPSDGIQGRVIFGMRRSYQTCQVETFSAYLLGPEADRTLENANVEAKSVKELVELARAKPGALSFASQGIGASGHIAGEQFRLLTRTNIVHVPYKGAAPALQDLRGGHVSMMFDVVPFALQHIQEGSVRGLAVATPQRLSVLPDIPTMAEVGYPEIQGGAWFALFAPANTPSAIIDLLNKEGRDTFALADVRQQLEPRGVVLVLGTPQQLGDFVVADTERWKKVIREAGIKLE